MARDVMWWLCCWWRGLYVWFYGVGLVMSVLQFVQILVMFVNCVVEKVLWWLRGVHKCRFELLVSMGSLEE